MATKGSVTRVITTRGSVWPSDAELREVLAIGVAEGSDALMLGSVNGVAATSERIYVSDASVPVVRVYDHAGGHVFDIGRDGEAPGEFRRPGSLGIGPGGRVFVRDLQLRRMGVFSSDGEPLDTIRLQQAVWTTAPMVVAEDGVPYTPDLRYESPAAEPTVAMVPYGQDGAPGSSLSPPSVAFEPMRLIGPGPPCVSDPVPYGPEYVWAMGRDRRMVGGVGSGYSFTVVRPGGSKLIVERQLEPVALHRDEREYVRAWYEAFQVAACGPGWSWNGPDIPDRKPAFTGIVAVDGGGYWVLRQGPGERVEDDCDETPRRDGTLPGRRCWGDPLIVDAFGQDGRFLGVVRVPAELEEATIQQVAHITTSHVYAPVVDEEGVVRIKKYALVVSSE